MAPKDLAAVQAGLERAGILAGRHRGAHPEYGQGSWSRAAADYSTPAEEEVRSVAAAAGVIG